MNYIALYRKYRPQTFDEVVEQETAVRILKQALKLKKISHAYLFAGPKGSGKTTLARILAKGLNCIEGPTDKPCLLCENCISIADGTSLDVMEIDAASNRGIDEIRELKDKINYVPVKSNYKVYIIDEAHMLTPQAFNALLKTLEEPPSNVVFILATTEPDKIPATIMSRCEHLYFKPITLDGLSKKISEVAKRESINIDDEAISLIARVSSGSLRNALSLFEQLITLYDGNITANQVRSVLEIPDENFISSFLNAIMENNPQEVLSKIGLMKDSGKDSKVFLSELIDYLNDLITGYITGFDSIGRKRDKKTIDVMVEQTKKTSLSKLTDISEKLLELSGKLKYFKDPFFPILISSIGMIKIGELAVKQQIKEENVFQESTKEISQEQETKETTSENLSKEKGSFSIEDIKNRWDEIKSVIKTKSVPLYAQMIRVSPIELREDLLVLDPEKNFYLTMLRKPENIEIIENAIKTVLGKVYRVAFLEHDEKPTLQKEDEIEKLSKKKEIQSVLKLFDGTITDIKDLEEEK